MAVCLWGGSQDVLANPNRATVCGVDVGYQPRCYRELKRLEQACRETPVICGQSFANGGTPQTETSKQHCLQMFRNQKKQWLESLCGVRLFSQPHTYCGQKGVEVAVACVGKHQAAGAIVPKRVLPPSGSASASGQTQRVSSATRGQKSVALVGSLAKTGQSSDSSSSKAATTDALPPVAVGQVKKVQPPTLEPSSSGSSFWLYAVQLLTLGLVLMLLWNRRDRQSVRPWEQRSRWSDVDESWSAPVEPDNTAMTRMETMLEQIELRLQVWEEQWREAQQEHEPTVALQRMGNAVHSYYCRLAEVIMAHQGRQPVSRVQRRVLESRDKMRWLFQAHREPPPLANAVERLQEELMASLQQILQQMGHIEGQQHIPEVLSQGSFSVNDFLTRKAADQAQRFLQNESLQSFSNIRTEYLQCVEQLYRSNLNMLLQPQEQEQTVAVLEQQQIFMASYILGYLLQELPRQMGLYSRQSKRDRSGALVDQLLQFIEEELHAAGLELFPVFDESEFISESARFLYLANAGVRLSSQPDVVLREASTELLQVRSPQPQPVVGRDAISVGESTAEYKSQVSEEEATKGLVSVTVARPPSRPPLPLDNTAAYSQDLLRDIDEVIMSYGQKEKERSIANPDSDPPTVDITTEMRGHRVVGKEQLPAGPLPILDMTHASQSPDLPKGYNKITEEYGTALHDNELPYSLSRHSSKEPS